MQDWTYGDFVLHLVAYTQGAYTAKEIEALADVVWKKQASPKFHVIQMETEPHAAQAGLLEEDDCEEYQDEQE